MTVNVNKIVKTFAIGAALYYCMDFFYDLGKGRMLGALVKAHPEVKSDFDMLANLEVNNLRDKLKLAVVVTTAQITMDEP